MFGTRPRLDWTLTSQPAPGGAGPLQQDATLSRLAALDEPAIDLGGGVAMICLPIPKSAF